MKQISLHPIGNNVFKYEDDAIKYLVRQVISGWQIEEYAKIDDGWSTKAIYNVKNLGAIILEFEE